MTGKSRAATSLLRGPLAVERETLAQEASSLAGRGRAPIRALSIVARAVSPTRAATSTRFAAATILDPIADSGSISIENSSACAELFARDNCEPRSKNALQLGGWNEAHCYTRRADFDLSRTTPQGSNLSSDCGWRNRLCIGIASIRSRDRGDYKGGGFSSKQP